MMPDLPKAFLFFLIFAENGSIFFFQIFAKLKKKILGIFNFVFLFFPGYLWKEMIICTQEVSSS